MLAHTVYHVFTQAVLLRVNGGDDAGLAVFDGFEYNSLCLAQHSLFPFLLTKFVEIIFVLGTKAIWYIEFLRFVTVVDGNR